MCNFLDTFSVVKLSKEQHSIVLLALYSLRTGSRWGPARTNESATSQAGGSLGLAACQVYAAVSPLGRIIL